MFRINMTSRMVYLVNEDYSGGLCNPYIVIKIVSKQSNKCDDILKDLITDGDMNCLTQKTTFSAG